MLEAPTAKEYIEKARELHEVEGEVEIDDVADAEIEHQVSRSEDQTGEMGAYVRAWVFVPRETIQPEWEG
jgi:hypothetical protein